MAKRERVVGVAERFGDGGEIALSLQHVANLLRESWGKFCCRGVNPNRQASSGRPEGPAAPCSEPADKRAYAGHVRL